MSKRLIIILALAFVVGIAFAAYAEVQNVKVSGDITVSAVGRNNLILRKNNNAPKLDSTQVAFNEYDHRISTVLSQVRARIDADLTDNVSTTVRLINERVWGVETNTSDTLTAGGTRESSSNVSIDLAYATMKEFLYSPLTLTIGRQELHFGNDLIIGDPDTNGLMAGHQATDVEATARANMGRFLPRSLDDLTLRKAFDAIRATLNYDPLVVDAVYALINEGRVDSKDDTTLYGLNANYALDKKTTLEAYYWQKTREKASPSGTAADVLGHSKNDWTGTLGGRAKYSGVKNLSLGLEGAYQFGKHVVSTTLYPDEAANTLLNRRRQAFAIQFGGSYSLAELIKKYDPMAGFSYTYLSGDKYKSTHGNFTGWDPMFENQAGGTLFNKILGYSNAQLYNASLSAKPIEDVKVALNYYYLRLNKPYYNANNANLTGVVGDPTYAMNNGKKSLGSEVDTMLTYDYTEDVQLGLNMGWFFPGTAFNKGTTQAVGNRDVASQIIGSMKVTF